jgi:putative hydrolase of the HAD superfamily
MDFPLQDELKDDLKTRIRALNRPMQAQPTGEKARLSRKLPGIRVVLFDIYGTMLTAGRGEIGVGQAAAEKTPATDALTAAGFACAGEECGFRAVEILQSEIRADHEQLRRQGVDYPEVEIRDVWQRTLDILIRDGHVRGLITPEAVQRLAVEYECRVNPAWPMQDLRQTLEALRVKDIVLGIVSNAQFYTPLIMDVFPETGWTEGWFDAGLCGWSYELRVAKPSLRLVEHVLTLVGTQLGIGPESVLCGGNDLANDIMPASRLGCRTALFAGDAKSLRLRAGDTLVEGIKPDSVITELGQLTEIIR